VVPATADKAAIEPLALASPSSCALPTAPAKKVIVVPGRLVNVVV
jgi:leucyl-tRNA synthetase